jgi:hypothetical protein
MMAIRGIPVNQARRATGLMLRVGKSITVVGWVSDPTLSMVGTESQPTQDAEENTTLFDWPVLTAYGCVLSGRED